MNPSFSTMQITEFECGGVAIGLSCSHMLSDPISATMLVRAWAETTLRGQIAAPPLFLPLPSPPPQQHNSNKPNRSNLNCIINRYKSAIQSPPPIPPPQTKQSTVSFHFDGEAVKSCIAMAGARRSPFEALAALFWTRISKIKGAEAGNLVGISLFLDARSALGLENSFFGNCMVFSKVEVKSGSDGVAEAAAMIGDTASRMDGGGVTVLIEWLEQEMRGDPPMMNGGDLICANLEEAGTYSAVFEEKAAPLRATYYIEPAVGAGQVIVMPAAEPEGRVVMVTLEEEEGRKLLEDSVIQQLATAVVMGLKKKKKAP